MRALATIVILAGVGAAAPRGAAASPEAATADPGPSMAPRARAYVQFLKARSRERVGDVDGAIEAYRATLEADPDSVSVRVSFASLLAEAHRMAESMDVLRQALHLDPGSVPARRMMAMTLYRLRGEPRGEAYDREVRAAFDEWLRVDPEDGEARRAAGRLAYEYNDLEAARTHFEKLLELRPEDIEGRFLLARTLFGLRQYAEAADLYAALEKDREEGGHFPDGERSGQVLSYLFAERYDEALRVAEEGLARTGEDSPEHLKFLKLKGFAAEGLGNVHLAAKTLERVVRLDPADREARFRLAQVQIRRRDFGPARELIETVLREMDESPQGPQADPPRLQVLMALAAIHHEQDRYGKALEALDAAWALADKDPRARAAITERRARSLVELGEAARARTVIEEAIAWGHEVEDLTLVLAELDLRQGDERHAERLLKQVVKDAGEERRREVLMRVADLHNRLKRYDAAHDVARQLASQFPGDEDVHFLLGTISERRGDLEAAEREFRRVLELNPESDRTLNYLGYMLADRGLKLEEAARLIERAVALDRSNGAYLDSLGWVQFRLGNLDAALASLMAALEQIVDDPVIYDHLGQVYERLGKPREARDAWRKALDHGSEDAERIEKLLQGGSPAPAGE